MTGTLSVHRWRRFGHDRVFVEDASRSSVGCLDLVTGQLTLERPELREAVVATLARHGHLTVSGAGSAEAAPPLDRLPAGWASVEQVPIGPRGATLDRLVVGPGGVFAVRSEEHRGAVVTVAGDEFRVDARRYPWVRSVRYEARRAGRLLSAALRTTIVVTGVVVVDGTRELSVRQQPTDVRVESSTRLARWLQALPAALAPHEVDRIRDAAHDPATWR